MKPDYGIIAVKYEQTQNGRRIAKALVYEVNKYLLTNERVMKREEIVEKMDKGKVFYTFIEDSEGNYEIEDPVKLNIIINELGLKIKLINFKKGEKITNYREFIRTEPNEEEEDNLGYLPEF